LELTVFKKS